MDHFDKKCKDLELLLEVLKIEYEKVWNLLTLSILGFATFLLAHAISLRFAIVGLTLLAGNILFLLIKRREINKVLKELKKC